LSEWHPSDASALNILKPWSGVFKEQHMDGLLARCVLPKLALALRELPINPAVQVCHITLRLLLLMCSLVLLKLALALRELPINPAVQVSFVI
jgi:tuftelin-interacting protein 11